MLEAVIAIGLVMIGIIAFFMFLVSLCVDIRICLVSAAVCAMCGILLIYPIVEADNLPYERQAEPYITHKIMALADGSAIQGRIYMRSATIDEKHRYTYGYETYNGGMKIQQINSDRALVFFTDSVEPCAKWYKETKKFWYFDWERYTCDIYLPTDALIADYSIDLQ